MKFIDILRVSFSTFTNNKMRTLLTILGVAIGISTIIFLVSIGYGLQQVTIGEIKSIKALTTYNVTTGNSGILALDQQALDGLKQIKNVVSVNGLVSMSGQISLEGKKTDVLVNDASAEYIDLESPKLVVGENFKNDKDNKIIVTEIVASAFNVAPNDLVGKTVKLNFYIPNPENSRQPIEQQKEYTVSGVIKDNAASYLFLPSGTIELPAKMNYNGAKVKVNENKNMEEVKAQLAKLGYKTTSIGERINEMNR